MPKILVFSGSTRRESNNRKLAAAATRSLIDIGAEVTLLDLRDFPMPIYEGDLEDREGVPAAAIELKAIFKAHAGLFIATPEYNGFFPPLLKNTIDWISRPYQGESGLVPYAGKVAAICAASPGSLGGIRVLPQLRLLLSNLQVTVLPQQLALASADKAFDAAGRLKEPTQAAALELITGELARSVRALAA